MAKTVCIYHVADMDGCCSVALLDAFLPKGQDPVEFAEDIRVPAGSLQIFSHFH